MSTSSARVHWFGSLVDGHSFPSSLSALYADISCISSANSDFRLIDGSATGRTTAAEADPISRKYTWAHPIAVGYQCKGLIGAPKLLIRLHNVDQYGLAQFVGAGVMRLPLRAGRTCADVNILRPISRYGLPLEYVNPDEFASPTPTSRVGVRTIGVGVVRVDVSAIVVNLPVTQ